jgi:hypothetical protein
MNLKSRLLTLLQRKFIIVELAGGLGNQIFLMEMARYLSNLEDRKILLDISNIDSLQFRGKSTLEDFLLSPDLYIIEYGRLFRMVNSYFKKYLNCINRINRRFILVLDEVGMGLNKSAVDNLVRSRKPKLIIMFGFYQNFEFWNTPFAYTLKSQSKTYEDLIRQTVETNPIILHYRTGVIGTLWEYQWGILSPEFYDVALSALSEIIITTRKPVWIFSDNINEVQKLLEQSDLIKKYKLIFVDDSKMTPAEILMLFSKSNYLICGNSTLSLAAAKIGNVANVIVPLELSKHEPVEIFMPGNWIKIKSVWLMNTHVS